jgi:cytochrome c peroxidase
MKKLAILLAVAISAAVCSFRSADTAFNTPKGWPVPVYDFKANPLSPEKIALGRSLFHDPLLSRNNTISCASCHLPNTAFTHIDHDLSHGIEGRIGRRNSPALMNLAWSKAFMWDGAVNHLDVQALAPLTNYDEMDESLTSVVQKLQRTPAYVSLFKAAYGDTLITGEHTLKALSQFMLTLVSADSKYDKVIRGEDSFNTYEAKGYSLFRANCASCHKEPLFTNGEFENNGLPVDTTLNDKGRVALTHRPSDSLKFKVPTLRNIEVSYPYMHDGRFRNLQMVLFYYTEGIAHTPTLSPRLQRKMLLTEDDKRALIAFLRTLTDEAFLHNPAFQYTQPQ